MRPPEPRPVLALPVCPPVGVSVPGPFLVLVGVSIPCVWTLTDLLSLSLQCCTFDCQVSVAQFPCSPLDPGLGSGDQEGSLVSFRLPEDLLVPEVTLGMR